MQIKMTDLVWGSLNAPGFFESLYSLRNQDIQVLRLRFTQLPWTSYLLCAPKDHIFGMHSVLETPTHARWRVSFPEYISEVFVQEHANRKLKLSHIPLNFYAYGSGDEAEPEASRIGWKVAPLCCYWFEPYLVPQTEECEQIFEKRIAWAVESLGWFFVRPFPDTEMDGESFAYEASTLDYLLFEAGPMRFEEVSLVTCALLDAIEAAEAGSPPRQRITPML